MPGIRSNQPGLSLFAATLAEASGSSASIKPHFEGTFRLFLTVFLAVTVLQRFAVPSAGSELGIGFVLCLVVVTLGLITGRFVVSVARLTLYAIATSAMLVTLLAKTQSFSFFSLFMLLTLYIPFVVVVELSADEWRNVLGMIQRVCSLCGLGQFLAQLAFGPNVMFPFDIVLPTIWFIPEFNLKIPVSDSLPLLKSTGLWFLEPSHFAQFLAFSIIIEFVYFKRPHVLALFGTAYLTSLSGSGVLLLAAVSLMSLIRRGRLFPLVLLAVGALTLAILHNIPPVSVFLERLDEFSSTQSSGSMRFLAPYWFVQDVVVAKPSPLLFGYGPGQMGNLGGALDYARVRPEDR